MDNKLDVEATAQSVVSWLLRKLDSHITHDIKDDCLQEARLAWWLKGSNYDPSQGASEYTYATWVMKSAVMDNMRTIDHLSRSHRRRVRTGEEIDPQTYDIVLESGDSAISMALCEDHGPFENLCGLQLAQLMPVPEKERDRDMFSRHMEGETLAVIGDSHGVTESRVSQIVDIYKQQLKRRIAAG